VPNVISPSDYCQKIEKYLGFVATSKSKCHKQLMELPWLVALGATTHSYGLNKLKPLKKFKLMHPGPSFQL